MHSPLFTDLTFDQQSTKQHQLHQYLVNRIMRGTLTAEAKLPSSRNLASSLGIGRNTVVAVLEQLVAEGFLTSHTGKGTFVSDTLPRSADKLEQVRWQPKFSDPPLSDFGKRIQNANKTSRKTGIRLSLPFTTGIPDLSVFPHKTWAKINRRHQDRTRLQAYDGSLGYAPLREALAEYLALSRGVICEPQQIIITQGAQQAIYLCCQVLLNAGDEVLTEEPGYQNAYHAFQAAGAKIKAIAVTENGIDIAKLPKATGKNTKLLYCTPTHQYPLGGILPAGKRIELLDWAARENVWLLEDDYDSEFIFHGKPINALQGMAPKTPVLYVGSFSKTLFPALRTGYLVVPKHLVSAFANAKMYIGGEIPLLNQATIADFITEGHFVTHLRKMRRIYEEKWRDMQTLVSDNLNDNLNKKVSMIARSAGMHLTLSIPGINDVTLKEQFEAAGFGSSALSSYYLKPKRRLDKNRGLVLGFANTTAAQRREGIEILAKLITDQTNCLLPLD